MAQTINKLTLRDFGLLKEDQAKDGVYGDGAGLHLRVRGKSRAWVFVYHAEGKRHEIGLGSAHWVGLAQARAKAAACRELLARGEDPMADRKRNKAKPTFGQLADELIETRSQGLRSTKSIERIRRAIGLGTRDRYQQEPMKRVHSRQASRPSYAEPIRGLRIDQISTEQVARAIKPYWTETPVSAALGLGYMAEVFSLANALGHRTGANPAAWDGNLEHVLQKHQRLRRGHHASDGSRRATTVFSKPRYSGIRGGIGAAVDNPYRH